jgi:hypothetical protein
LVAEIEATVARRRAAGEYPEALLDRLSADFHIVRHDEPMEALVHIHTHATPVNRRPVIGRGVVFSKRLLRRAIAWYVQPIAAQQTSFNLAAVREVRSLQRRIERLETPWQRPHRAPGAATDAAVLGARAAAMIAALADGTGPILVLPGITDGLRDALVAEAPALANRLVMLDSDPIAELHRRTTASLGAVVAPATLAMVSSADLLSVIALAGSKLALGGTLVVDAPANEGRGAPADPSSIDPAMCRWVHRDTVALLAEAAGLTMGSVAEVAGGWYSAVATRSTR